MSFSRESFEQAGRRDVTGRKLGRGGGDAGEGEGLGVGRNRARRLTTG